VIDLIPLFDIFSQVSSYPKIKREVMPYSWLLIPSLNLKFAVWDYQQAT
jgi:hypothetical protein